MAMAKLIPVLTRDDVFARLMEAPQKSRANYFAMYSTWLGGITTDPQLMLIPIDDHIVHRGDGVFEAAKCIDGQVYALDRHLDRLALSAARVGLTLPHSADEIRAIALQALKVSKATTAMIRLYISRGPGGFTANPYESLGSQMYLVITPYAPVSPSKYETGVEVRISRIGVKEGFFSQVKSCNYLPNVLMKKESVDLGVDFTVAREDDGAIAESSTENFGIITENNEFVVPGFERTLKGITAIRLMELAQTLVQDGRLRAVRNGRLKLDDVRRAKEAMMIGTTLDCLPVTRFENEAVGSGKVGPVCRALLDLLRADMRGGPLTTSL